MKSASAKALGTMLWDLTSYLSIQVTLFFWLKKKLLLCPKLLFLAVQSGILHKHFLSAFVVFPWWGRNGRWGTFALKDCFSSSLWFLSLWLITWWRLIRGKLCWENRIAKKHHGNMLVYCNLQALLLCCRPLLQYFIGRIKKEESTKICTKQKNEKESGILSQFLSAPSFSHLLADGRI